MSISLPLAVENSTATPDPQEQYSPSVAARLDRWFAAARDYIAHAVLLDDSHLDDPDTSLSRTQMLSLAIGFLGCDTPEHRNNRTYTLIYTDPDQGTSNYQTLAVPYYAPSSPIIFARDPRSRAATLSLRSSGETIADVVVHARILGASQHYYSRVAPDFTELPTAAIVSPYSTCAGGCLGCSRGAVSSFTAPPRNYIVEHVTQLAADYDRRGWDRGALVSVNITTGCQPDEGKELTMMLALMAEYRRQGFSNAAFHVFTYAIHSTTAMTQLLEAGAIGFVGTIETINDQERIRQWGKKKGAITFEQHVEKYRRAHQVGFPIVETDYVLGADSYDEMIEGILELDRNRVAVVPNIKRNYDLAQLHSNHDDIWSMGMPYIVDGFHAALATYRHGTIKRRAARKSLEYLRARGWELSLRDLPIRHT